MLNQISIMGRLVAAPEMRATSSGISVANFTVACERDFKTSDGTKQTDFVDIIAWANTADFVGKYLAKGRMAIIAGRLQTRNWTDQNGNKRKTVEVIAESVYFGDSKKNTDSEGAQEGRPGTLADLYPTMDAGPKHTADTFEDFASLDEELPF